MPIPNMILASGNFTKAGSFVAAVDQFIVDRSPTWSLISKCEGVSLCLKQYGSDLLEWISRPHVLAVLIAWSIAFTLFATVILCLGFGPTGVLPGTLAAAFQSFMYGGFTPAGGIFATLTSLGMLGILCWPAALVAGVLATVVAAIVWACGVGT